MGEPDWGPWIEHNGQGCPCEGRMVRAQRADSSIVEGIASGEPHPVVGNAWLWSSVPKWHAGHIVKRYRLRKPRALLDLIEMVENLPAPVAPMVMA